MRTSWVTVLLLIVALPLAGCKSAPPQQVRVPDQTTPTSPPEPSPTTGVPQVTQPKDEIAKWTAIVAKEPTADNWNELSFANLQAQQWQDAAKAGEEALKLERDHAFALYNTGTALVELGQTRTALAYLPRSSALQPTRYEPHKQLARAYQSLGHYLLARYHVGKAVALSTGDAEIAKLQESVTAMLEGAPPADFANSCAQKLTNGQLFLCVFRESAPQQHVFTPASAYLADRYTFYIAPGGKPIQRIPLGYTAPGKLVPTSLPGGITGYWLSGGPVGAGAADTSEWRLFIWDGNDMHQVLFTGGDDYEGKVSDFMRSPNEPHFTGDTIITAHRDDVTGSRTIETTRRLSVTDKTAAVIVTAAIIAGQVTKVSPDIEVSSGYAYKWAYPLAKGAEVRLDGKASAQDRLAVGMYATITVEDGHIMKVDATSK